LVRDILPGIAAGIIPFGTGQMALNIARRKFIAALRQLGAAIGQGFTQYLHRRA
jgi:hypothetical protein